MRALYFSQDYTTHDWNFLEKLRGGGREVHYLRLEDSGGRFERRPLPKGVRAIAWPGGRGPQRGPAALLGLMPALEEVLARLRPDLVHAGPIPSCGFMAALAGARPLILQSWGSDVLLEARRDPEAGFRARFALRRSDGLVCDCDAVRESVAAELPYGTERIAQFPWGVDLRRFRPGADPLRLRRRKGWADALILLSTRSWEPIYGIPTLLEAFRIARRTAPALRFVLVGSGSLAPELDRRIKAGGLTPFVHRPGRVAHSRLPGYFRAADLYVGGSASDGTSVSLLEAMACGLPSAVTDLPGNREWVQPARNGWLYPSGDARALAAILDTAARDSESLRRMGRESLRVARERADWDRNFPALHRLYERLGRRTLRAGRPSRTSA